jgi:hypothetical protein
MKISELTNAPDWLKAAVVENEDVAINTYGRVTWRGGNWLGGDWYGGDWLGGTWRGGNWRDGDWYDGNWRGGDWYDGNWYGGNWRGGNWYGGNWRDGDWFGGTRLLVRLGFDLRGYAFMLNLFKGKDVVISAGCRHFTLDDARAHWLSDYYSNSDETNVALIRIFLDSAERVVKEVWKK